ncbi:unnamed protein product [Urochloa decumbens]|uniref:KIB1-4 beta-propeller domain-containing protein n=1 Tax=Urochloa decumbens TaxID=240449 RepID=A0ABC9E2L9_9POAL
MTSSPAAPCLVFDYGGEGEHKSTTLFSVSDGAHRAGTRAPPPTGSRALPPLPQQPTPWWSVCALSGSPTAAGGCTVLLAEPPQSGDVLWYCHAGGSARAATWSRHEYDLGGGDGGDKGPYISCSIGLASCRGRFYYNHSSTECGVIDFSLAAAGTPPALSTLPMEPVPLPFAEAASLSTVEIDGELYTVAVYIHYRGAGFHAAVAVAGIYRMDLGRREHVRVESVGDRAILASSGRFFGGGGWCPATEFGLIPNSVYWMSYSDRRLHVFDLELGTEEVRELYEGVADAKHHHPRRFG